MELFPAFALIRAADTGQTYRFGIAPAFQAQAGVDAGTSATAFIAKNLLSGVGKAAAGAALKGLVNALTGSDSDEQLSRELRDQLHDLGQNLNQIERDLNQMGTQVLDATRQIDNDVNSSAYNAYYASNVQADIDEIDKLDGRLTTIVNLALHRHPDLPKLRKRIASFQRQARAELGTADAESAADRMVHWKTLMVSNGYGTSGLVQLWSHYVAHKSMLYGPAAAAEVQAQWDFMDARWMQYVGLQLAALGSVREVPEADRRALLQAWARNRQDVVAQLWGGWKTAAQLSAEVQLPEPGDAGINRILQQSVPRPLPALTTLNQADGTLWWLQPGYQSGADTAVPLGSLLGAFLNPAYDRSMPTYSSEQAAAVDAAQRHWNDAAWGLPGISRYQSLQASLLADHLDFQDAGFAVPDDGGQTAVVVPVGDAELTWQSSNEGVYGTDRVIGDLLARAVFEPTGKIQTWNYLTRDPAARGDDGGRGCPRAWADWDLPVSTDLTGNLYRMFSGEVWERDLWGTHPRYFTGYAFRNKGFGGCALDSGAVQAKVNLAFYLTRNAGSEPFTHW